MKKPMSYGLIASLFFAFTFVLNSSMNLSGGHWMWSACLRYFLMLPLLYLIVLKQGSVKKVFTVIKAQPMAWLLWSSVGFGLFYLPLTLASNYGQSWLVAGCWQLTIIAGILLTPLFGQKLPLKSLGLSVIILIGVFMIQYEQATTVNGMQALFSLGVILIAAFAYPLGNRKMMAICKGHLSATERVFGMTLCSMPFWLVTAVIAYSQSGLPPVGQVCQSGIVALFSGVIATILFFKATDLTKHHPHQLALVEATQSGEVIFSVLGEIFILGGAIPSFLGFSGLLLIIIGMILNSLVVSQS